MIHLVISRSNSSVFPVIKFEAYTSEPKIASISSYNPLPRGRRSRVWLNRVPWSLPVWQIRLPCKSGIKPSHRLHPPKVLQYHKLLRSSLSAHQNSPPRLRPQFLPSHTCSIFIYLDHHAPCNSSLEHTDC
jgi:hypothetical protein